jgi:glycosyltransferase involved in cell wall biosynthesis
MKIFLLSDSGSIHTKRWVSALSGRGMTVFLFGLNTMNDIEYYQQYPDVIVQKTHYTNSIKGLKIGSITGKIRYLLAVMSLKRCIKQFQPDILHAHYASSYGLLGALSGFHPYILSVWGSDVYDFPNISFLHKRILKYNLSKADRILSTSHIMATEARRYTNKSITITPFGVDLSLFKKQHTSRHDDIFVVGNVKTLAPKYGIDVLIHAFKMVIDNNPHKRLCLEIVGEGPDKEKLEQLARNLGISEYVIFRGKIENHMLPLVYNAVSVSVSVSDSESFGVVAVEAMACECPVVVSDADGFTEVVANGETGFIVPKRDVSSTAAAIQKFIDNPLLRIKMGQNGRKRVEELYDWNKNVNKMLSVYQEIMSK